MITVSPVHIPSPTHEDQALILSQGPLRRCRRHYVVPSYVLVYVVEGHGVYEREDTGQQWQVSPGCIMQRFPGVPHRVEFDTEEPWQIHLIVPKQVYDLSCFSGDDVESAVLFPDSRHDDALLALSSNLDGVINYREALNHFQVAIESILSIARGDSARSSQDWLMHVKGHLVAHLESGISMESVAEQFDMAYVTFRRRFKQEAGESPFAWLLKQRLTRAQDLLRSTELSIQDISRFCGFQTIYTFSHAFKEKFATSPTQYRQAHEMSD